MLLWSFLCLACGLNLARFRQDVLEASPDRAANTDRRFQGLRQELSRRERVGYITDRSDTKVDPAEQYFLAQLALAPTVVEFDSSPELIVGNFFSTPHPQIPSEFVLVRDFGNGVMLLRKR